ncbi:SDR family oxidoreductase [Streptomyces decoyicus]|uniref:SDR family oxidoreductase n=1 Tax=Streptomyces decoyicus TaxID=249567 RepID=UPI003629A569
MWAALKHELRHRRAQGSGGGSHRQLLLRRRSRRPPRRASYHASQHGVIGLTSSAALESAPRGPRINAVCADTINSPMVR